MTNYCKSNVRRVINYTNTEPLNKYDLWLSENLRYNEDGELEYDNNGLPACDLILKIFRNGKWEPIVGYNTTAGNKINVVNNVDYTYTIPNYNTQHLNHGFQQNHLPLFRNPLDSPDELFDAGTLGEALIGFVTYTEWSNLFQTSWFTSAFNNNIIGGNDYNWTHLIQNLISSGDINLPLATYEDIGGIRCQTDTTDLDYRGLPVVFGGPNAGLTYSGSTPMGFTLYGDSLTYNPDNSFLYIPGWALNDWLQDPTGQGTTLPFPIDPGSVVIALDTVLKNTSSIGWRVITTSSNPSISPDIWGVDTGNAGKYLRIKQLSEWPTIPSGETAPTGGWNQINNVMEWVDLPEGVQYTGVNLIKVDSSNNEIGINMDSNPSAGDIIICESTGNGLVAKWGAVPNPSLAIINIECGSGDLTLSNNILSVTGGSFTINNESYASDSYVLNEWIYYVISDYKSLAITSLKLTANPVYMRFSPRASISNFTCVGDVIDAQGVLTDSNFYEDAFVTLQFGIAKFEKIQTVS